MKTKTMTTLHLRKSIGRSPCRGALLLIPLAIAATFAEAAVAAPSPGVVAGGFCPFRAGYPSAGTQAAAWIKTYFAAGSGRFAFFSCRIRFAAHRRAAP